MSTENKDIQDKLSWNNINQLHEAVSNFSKQSFDIKKLWITVEVSIVTFLLTQNDTDVKIIILVSGIVLLFFYMLDSMTYYYQDKLREKMSNEQNAIRKRNKITTKSFDRKGCRFLRSIFNWSHLLYYIVAFLLVIIYKLC